MSPMFGMCNPLTGLWTLMQGITGWRCILKQPNSGRQPRNAVVLTAGTCFSWQVPSHPSLTQVTLCQVHVLTSHSLFLMILGELYKNFGNLRRSFVAKPCPTQHVSRVWPGQRWLIRRQYSKGAGAIC